MVSVGNRWGVGVRYRSRDAGLFWLIEWRKTFQEKLECEKKTYEGYDMITMDILDLKT